MPIARALSHRRIPDLGVGEVTTAVVAERRTTISDVGYEIWDIRYPTSNIKYQLSHIPYRSSNSYGVPRSPSRIDRSVVYAPPDGNSTITGALVPRRTLNL
jgi:hypothetical protein